MDGLTNKEAYEKIIEQNLYEFPAKKPESVVNGILRRHCFGGDFPTANSVKYFRIVGYKGKKPLYSIIETNDIVPVTSKKDITDDEVLPEEKIQEFYNEHLSESDKTIS